MQDVTTIENDTFFLFLLSCSGIDFYIYYFSTLYKHGNGFFEFSSQRLQHWRPEGSLIRFKCGEWMNQANYWCVFRTNFKCWPVQDEICDRLITALKGMGCTNKLGETGLDRSSSDES